MGIAEVGIFAAAGLVIITILVFVTLVKSCYTINENERGVVLRFGRLVATTEPGFNKKRPFFDKVVKLPVLYSDSPCNGINVLMDGEPFSVNIRVVLELDPNGVAQAYRTRDQHHSVVLIARAAAEVGRVLERMEYRYDKAMTSLPDISATISATLQPEARERGLVIRVSILDILLDVEELPPPPRDETAEMRRVIQTVLDMAVRAQQAMGCDLSSAFDGILAIMREYMLGQFATSGASHVLVLGDEALPDIVTQYTKRVAEGLRTDPGYPTERKPDYAAS